MPTYAYACTQCDNRFDAVQSFSDDALTVCPACQGRLRKVFNSVGVVFKGSGFYRNDSRSSSTSSEPGKSSGSSDSGSGSNTTSSTGGSSDKAASSSSTSSSSTSTSSSASTSTSS